MNALIFFGSFFTICFLIYVLIQNNIRRNNKKIENSVQSYILKKYENLKGDLILYPFIDSELNSHNNPEKYDFIFCSFGLIILSKHYKPIITLYSQKAHHIENLKINKCNLLQHKVNSISKAVELHLSGIGHITKIKVIIKFSSKAETEEICKLINEIQTSNN